MTSFTPDGYAAALDSFGASIRPAVKRALDRSASIPRAIYMANAAKHGILRTIFGGHPAGLGSVVKTKVVDRGTSFVLALELRGLAALQEEGGRTKPHQILPKHAKVLRLGGGGMSGLGFVKGGVLHPGSTIRKFPVATSSMVSAAPRIAQAIEKSIAEFRAGGAQIATSRAA